jgi:Epoxide hydrolase N terminus
VDIHFIHVRSRHAGALPLVITHGWPGSVTEMLEVIGPLPVGFTTFPDEIFRAPRSWVEALYPHVIYFHQAARGGHFAGWEEPGLFTEELRRLPPAPLVGAL